MRAEKNRQQTDSQHCNSYWGRSNDANIETLGKLLAVLQ